MQAAVFLDRDGTMVKDVGYLSRLDDLEWFPYTIDAVRLLNRAEYLVFIVSNQGGVGLGFYPEAFVTQTHEAMNRQIAASGGRVDGWFYCPHHPRAVLDALRLDCDCRKPRAGMVRQALERFPIDLARSFVVGDKVTDVGLARTVGARGVLVRTGYGEVELARAGGSLPDAALVAADLMEATSWILGQAAPPAAGA